MDPNSYQLPRPMVSGGRRRSDIGYGYGENLTDNALTPDPTLPGFPVFSTSHQPEPG